MLNKREVNAKTNVIWEEKRPSGKKNQLYKQTHRQQQQLRTLTKAYSQSDDLKRDFDNYFEDFWT